MDDNELAHLLARDLDGAFETLVHTHVDRCHAIALRMTGNPHDAQDVAQDALVRAYRALATYEPDRIRELRIRPWLTTIVLNLCRNRARSRALPSTPSHRWSRPGSSRARDERTDPAGIALRDAARERLAVHLAALPERYRVPVVLRHVDDLSYAELAEVLAARRAPSRRRSTGASPSFGRRWPASSSRS